MVLFFQILGFALFIFWLLLIARVVVEFIRSFSRDWHPTGITVVVLEIIMSITDPPVKLLRRLIPNSPSGRSASTCRSWCCCWWRSSGCSWRSAPRRDPIAVRGLQAAVPPRRRFGHVLASVWFPDLKFLRFRILLASMFEIGSYLLG